MFWASFEFGFGTCTIGDCGYEEGLGKAVTGLIEGRVLGRVDVAGPIFCVIV